MNPTAGNPLRSRADFARAVGELLDPLCAHASPGHARVRPVATGAHFPDEAAELEGVARPLWGLAPLSVHGDASRWEAFRTGLINGTDPEHPEYWGRAGDRSQKHVEMASIGVALALVPEHCWEPLTGAERDAVAAWLGQVNDAVLPDSNWLWFRVAVNLGLRSVGARHDRARAEADLDRIESFHVGDGWYTDGPADAGGAVDYYLPWAIHYFGLLYAGLAGDDDPARAERFRERAAAFADHYRRWFDAEGRAIPHGRSLTYRFAQASFWGALAFAGVDALPWGELRGLWARNVRWWLDQPIFTDGGLLSVGYRYPTLKTAETYNSPNSPYWGLTAFLPLALDADHPFWAADEAPLPDAPAVSPQPAANRVVCRDAEREHLFALSVPQSHPADREKYGKFAYSAFFGFSVADRTTGPGHAGHESALALGLDGEQYRIPGSVEATRLSGTTLASRWEPWDGVRVETWLAPALPWHVRVHRIESDRRVYSEEGGFALDRTHDDPEAVTRETGGGRALARYPGGTSVVASLRGGREASLVEAEPNTNLHHPRTVVPTLRGVHEAGTRWTGTAVLAAPDPTAALDGRPTLSVRDDAAVAETAAGEAFLECAPGDTDR